MVDDLFLLFEQLGAIRLGDEIAGTHQLAVIDFPLFEKLDVPKCPDPMNKEWFWADDSFGGRTGAEGLPRVCWVAGRS